jgi:hypothetical protein
MPLLDNLLVALPSMPLLDSLLVALPSMPLLDSLLVALPSMPLLDSLLVPLLGALMLLSHMLWWRLLDRSLSVMEMMRGFRVLAQKKRMGELVAGQLLLVLEVTLLILKACSAGEGAPVLGSGTSVPSPVRRMLGVGYTPPCLMGLLCHQAHLLECLWLEQVKCLACLLLMQCLFER